VELGNIGRLKIKGWKGGERRNSKEDTSKKKKEKMCRAHGRILSVIGQDAILGGKKVKKKKKCHGIQKTVHKK